MASTANLVLDNFIWRIEGISPTVDAAVPFKYLDGPHTAPLASSRDRVFDVQWEGSADAHTVDGQPITAVDNNRITDHVFVVTVRYPAEQNQRGVSKRALEDRHDILKRLRDGSLWVGYDDNNTATDLGLHNRYRTEDKLELDDNTWTYTSQWTCTIEESE